MISKVLGRRPGSQTDNIVEHPQSSGLAWQRRSAADADPDKITISWAGHEKYQTTLHSATYPRRWLLPFCLMYYYEESWSMKYARVCYRIFRINILGLLLPPSDSASTREQTKCRLDRPWTWFGPLFAYRFNLQCTYFIFIDHLRMVS